MCPPLVFSSVKSEDEFLWSLGPQGVLTLSKAGLASSLSSAFSILLGLEPRPEGWKTGVMRPLQKAYLVQAHLVAGVYHLKGPQVKRSPVQYRRCAFAAWKPRGQQRQQALHSRTPVLTQPLLCFPEYSLTCRTWTAPSFAEPFWLILTHSSFVSLLLAFQCGLGLNPLIKDSKAARVS